MGNKSNESKPPTRNYIWIDSDIESNENKKNYRELFEKYNNISCERFKNIDDAFNHLMKKENNVLGSIFIMISGKLFTDFYYKIKNNISSIKFNFKIFIFCRQKNLLINQLKMNNIYYNNYIFDKKLIFTKLIEVKDFIFDRTQKENELTFDLIDNLEQLIMPSYYSYLLEDVNEPEIQYFNKFLKDNFKKATKEELKLIKDDKTLLKCKKGNEEIQNLIYELENNLPPKEILIKWWLIIYSLQSDYYRALNKSLRLENKEALYYYPFIKLCYEGIRKGYLDSYDKEIYRASQISKKEFAILEERLKITKSINNIYLDIPKIIVFSRSFLSFSIDKNIIDKFAGHNDNSFSILYIIEEIQNKEKIGNKVSNAYIGDISKYANEKEVLVFPFSCFEIVEIKKIEDNEKYDYEIHLKYLGNYSKYIKEQFGTNFFDKIEMSNFSQDLIKFGILNDLKCF